MNKRKLLTRGVLFGYGAIGAQMVYSFASIPLALSYLTTPEFGMWSLIGTITGYIMIAEMGIVNSVMRHLLECKGTDEPEKYGRIFTASALALTGISLIVLALGVLAAFFCGRFFPIPPDLSETFFWVMLLRGAFTALTLATRITGVPLYVHHRQDLSQINQIGLFVVYFVVLYLAFRARWNLLPGGKPGRGVDMVSGDEHVGLHKTRLLPPKRIAQTFHKRRIPVRLAPCSGGLRGANRHTASHQHPANFYSAFPRS